MAFEVTRFSGGRKKQATASCRERMTEIEGESLDNQVRKIDRPIVIFRFIENA